MRIKYKIKLNKCNVYLKLKNNTCLLRFLNLLSHLSFIILVVNKFWNKVNSYSTSTVAILFEIDGKICFTL